MRQPCPRDGWSGSFGPRGPDRATGVRPAAALTRRSFLQRVGLGAFAIGGASWLDLAPQSSAAPTDSLARTAPAYPGRVVEVANASVASAEVQQDLVTRMLERGLIELTGARDAATAWSLFVAPTDIVGIKVNTLSGPGCSTRREVVQAIVAGLRAAGVKDENIIIWDRFESHLRRTRYQVQQRPGGIRCYATDSVGVGNDSDVFYQANVLEWFPEHLKRDLQSQFAASYNNSHFSAIFTRHITKQINVPVLKDHNIAGMTLALKNLAFGICGNTERFHPTPINCDPMIAEVCAHPLVRARNVLNVADCLTVLYEGGPIVDPQYVLPYGALLVGTDPVAVDRIGLEILERIRTPKGLPSLWKTTTPPKYLQSAGRLKVGVESLDLVEHRKVGVTG
ncbi:MAG: DUF362 domain-containing protein [Acidobacteria bacterium]|nr:DUF362 domain-containing protein [Acidobacteriota bacterium]